MREAMLIGEENCAADRSILDGPGEGLKQIIDPIDGAGMLPAVTLHMGRCGE